MDQQEFALVRCHLLFKALLLDVLPEKVHKLFPQKAGTCNNHAFYILKV
jgi:hypothetical protein